MSNQTKPLPPQEAAKLIKFYLNLYPDLVNSLKKYFPKPVIKQQTTFNRTIRVKLPYNLKTDISVRLAQEMSFVSWWWEGALLYIPYTCEDEFIRFTHIISKIAKEFRVRGLQFNGIKKSPKKIKQKSQTAA